MITVCIPAAGSGQRMGKYCEHLPKALLPLGKKAAITWIIEKFPIDTEFVIALGHKGELIQQYLKVAHPDRKIQFVNVANYSGKGSGPGSSILQCRPYLQKPFYFASCDTLWDGDLHLDQKTESWLGVASVPEKESKTFCNIRVEGTRVVSVHDKVPMDGNDWFAFSGLAFVYDFGEFWDSLEKGQSELIDGELQFSKGISTLVSKNKLSFREIPWIDIGDEQKYVEHSKRFHSYDFSKPDEALFQIGNRVIKFFANKSVSKNRVERIKKNQNKIFPPIIASEENFFVYEFMEGLTLYEACSPNKLEKALQWLDSELWRPLDVDQEAVRKICQVFYREKTYSRVESFFEKTGQRDCSTNINGRLVPSTRQLLESVPWPELYDGIPVFFHGDLHFDHIVEQESEKFVLLDWRHDFGGQTYFGDLYYDLSKFLGGLILNYSYIKENRFSYEENPNGIQFDFARSRPSDEYTKIFFDFIEKKNLSERKIRILTALIFLNMSPLHHHPFDRILHSLGKLQLAEILL